MSDRRCTGTLVRGRVRTGTTRDWVPLSSEVGFVGREDGGSAVVRRVLWGRGSASRAGRDVSPSTVHTRSLPFSCECGSRGPPVRDSRVPVPGVGVCVDTRYNQVKLYPLSLVPFNSTNGTGGGSSFTVSVQVWSQRLGPRVEGRGGENRPTGGCGGREGPGPSIRTVKVGRRLPRT